MKDLEERKTTKNYDLACRYEDWANQEKFFETIKSCQDFYFDKQFPNDNYNNMPRVQVNFCKYAVDLQTSKIVGTPVYISFVADNDNVNCLHLEQFDAYNCSKLNEDVENKTSVRDAKIAGFDLIMYRWDDNDFTYKGIYKGGLVLEHINPRSIFLDDVSCSYIQNQKWIGYYSDEDVASVRAICEGGEERKKLILPDDDQNVDPNDLSINTRRVRVYTRFFRINGEVVFTCSTKYVDLFKYPHFMNPRLQSVMNKRLEDDFRKREENPEENDELTRLVDYDMDFEDLLIPVGEKEKETLNSYKKSKEKFSLYPFALLETSTIHGKWYGRSDVNGLRSPNQGINFIYSMILMCAQNNAYNKIFAKEGALKGQEITNEPAQVITDYTKMTNGWGIKLAESQPMPNGLIDFVERFIQELKTINGVADVLGGAIENQDLSGVAVSQMIKQANSPIEQQQKLFWAFLKDKTAIRLQFYKHFVDQARYTYQEEDYKVSEYEKARFALERMQKQAFQQGKQLEVGNIGKLEPYKKTRIGTIENKDMWGTSFDINIEVLQGVADSELVRAQFWENLAINGALQSMSPEVLELYLEANPMVNKRDKDALRNIVEQQKQSENAKLKEVNQQLTSKLEEAVGIINEMGTKLKTSSEFNKNLESEFTGKINAQNKIINDLMQQGGKQQSPSEVAMKDATNKNLV